MNKINWMLDCQLYGKNPLNNNKKSSYMCTGYSGYIFYPI